MTQKIISKHLDLTRLTVLLHMYLVGEGCSKMPWPLVLQLSLERNTIRRSLSTFSLVLHFYLLTEGLETTQQDLKITKPVSTLEAKSCHFSEMTSVPCYLYTLIGLWYFIYHVQIQSSLWKLPLIYFGIASNVYQVQRTSIRHETEDILFPPAHSICKNSLTL